MTSSKEMAERLMKDINTLIDYKMSGFITIDDNDSPAIRKHLRDMKEYLAQYFEEMRRNQYIDEGI